MLILLSKIFFLIFFLIYQTSLYSKSADKSNFKSENLSDYFSALISINNKENTDALKYFNSSKSLIARHDSFLQHYVNSLVIEGKVSKGIQEIKYANDNKSSDFFEAYLLLILESIKKKEIEKSKEYLNQISRFKENGTYEFIIYNSLKSYIYLFDKKKLSKDNEALGGVSRINRAFQSCYLGKKNTEFDFINLINDVSVDYSRYIFFYINYLISNNRFNEAKEITDEINILDSSIIVQQTKNWIENENLSKFNNIFSCKNEKDILSEFMFLIANLYSTQNNFEKANFYLQISNFLNPKFNLNFTLLAENYYLNENYKQTEKILENFNKNDDVYYWYKIKKKAQIISKQEGKDKSFNFINSKFQEIKKPSIKVLFDMANISKNFEKYNIAINFYTKILLLIDKNSTSYSKVLYRRGGSHERLGQYNRSDEDMLNSLEINPNDAYVLNYLAYSWLERNYKIDTAIIMLEKAYNLKKNDPYIIDSIGWAYYLIGDFAKAEKFLKRAVELMPDDPIVNDHYGDILWKLDRKLEAKYFWQNVLNFNDTEESMKKEINFKILKGPKKT